MAKHFSSNEWKKINELLQVSKEKDFGLPARRSKSVVIGTFNIRELGGEQNRREESWAFLTEICRRFDLLAIQEVLDDLDGLRKIKEALDGPFGLVVSDVTGLNPGRSVSGSERLAYLFNWSRIARTELASDITYDRSSVIDSLKEKRAKWNTYLKNHLEYKRARSEYKKAKKRAKANNQPAPPKPDVSLPEPPGFLTFIRQPHCASFRIVAKNDAEPIEFLAVNAHLHYGDFPSERLSEFHALVEWLTRRAKRKDRMYHTNMILLGDCNLEFKKAKVKRDDIDALLKQINESELKNAKAAKVNFPMLDEHPHYGFIRTNVRLNQTYDQIAIFAHDPRLPDYKANRDLTLAANDYNFGSFNFVNLFAQALYKRPFVELPPKKKKHIIDRTQWDVTDHMPAWIRLPIPGA